MKPMLVKMTSGSVSSPFNSAQVTIVTSLNHQSSLCPGYISRSVAGSYDNEAVAIFALLTCFYLWVRAVNLGTVSSGVAAAFGYLYMAASWGAYVFISNLIPLYVIVMVCCGR